MINGILDTSVVIDLLRRNPQATHWYATLKRQRMAITPTVWMEIVEGSRNKIEQAQIIRFLFDFHIEHPTPDDNQWAMLQLGRFHLSHGIQFDDLMIASVVVRLNTTLYTLNMKHFAPLPGISVQKP